MKKGILMAVLLLSSSVYAEEELLALGGVALEEKSPADLLEMISSEGVEIPLAPSLVPIAKNQVALSSSDINDILKEEENLPWLRVITAFLFVSSLIFLAAALFRKKLEKRGGRGFSGDAATLRILQTVSIGMKRQLIVVRFDDMRLVLGATGQQIQVLCTKSIGAAVATDKERKVVAPESVPAWPVPAAVAITEPPQASVERREPSPDLSERIRQAVKNLKPLFGGRKIDLPDFPDAELEERKELH